jgi:anhydro-N-acetylmuramic acid kinase
MASASASLYVGLMSGTSLDGVDAALVDLSAAPKLVATRFVPYPADLKRALLELHDAGHDELHRAMLLAGRVSELYVHAIAELLGPYEGRAVAAIGCHGQTVRHRPELGYTVQLINGALIAERTAIDTVVDFRSRDIAAGGQGAPLVPAFHAACWRDSTRTRTIVNIGGIANATYLPPNGPVIGFDTGPGNMLLDAWAQTRFGTDYDRDGAIGSGGTVNPELLAGLLRDPYFDRPPPKSTGRDLFNLSWLESQDPDRYPAEDVQATLVELTAVSIAYGVTKHCPGTSDVFVCGGGAHNSHLMGRLAASLPNASVRSTSELGIDPDWVEAMAFAWLAQRTLLGEPGNMHDVTGAAGPRILGAIYPA